ncbi:hypothetical protein OH76DRAFT_1423808 [Lentinus brumalis]|uniref:Uncharacterized protein n=1 Tax=Lentinus brumalis TaxID=2498619 RepID=A0A371CIZ7_9APHY|nr:hypothetical protein OH76DRAFT_1423808 [Polyporus brumalis]
MPFSQVTPCAFSSSPIIPASHPRTSLLSRFVIATLSRLDENGQASREEQLGRMQYQHLPSYRGLAEPWSSSWSKWNPDRAWARASWCYSPNTSLRDPATLLASEQVKTSRHSLEPGDLFLQRNVTIALTSTCMHMRPKLEENSMLMRITTDVHATAALPVTSLVDDCMLRRLPQELMHILPYKSPVDDAISFRRTSAKSASTHTSILRASSGRTWKSNSLDASLGGTVTQEWHDVKGNPRRVSGTMIDRVSVMWLATVPAPEKTDRQLKCGDTGKGTGKRLDRGPTSSLRPALKEKLRWASMQEIYASGLAGGGCRAVWTFAWERRAACPELRPEVVVHVHSPASAAAYCRPRLVLFQSCLWRLDVSCMQTRAALPPLSPAVRVEPEPQHPSHKDGCTGTSSIWTSSSSSRRTTTLSPADRLQIPGDRSILEAAPASGMRLSRERHRQMEHGRERDRDILKDEHAQPSFAHQGWGGGMARWRLLALNAASGRCSPGYTGVCLDIPQPPPGGFAHTFKPVPVSRSRSAALRASVSSALSDTGSIRGPRYPQPRPSYPALLRTAARASPSRTSSCPPSYPHTILLRRDVFSG